MGLLETGGEGDSERETKHMGKKGVSRGPGRRRGLHKRSLNVHGWGV